MNVIELHDLLEEMIKKGYGHDFIVFRDDEVEPDPDIEAVYFDEEAEKVVLSDNPFEHEMPNTERDPFAKYSVHELAQALRNKAEVVAVTVWQEDDIISALEKAGYEATRERINKVCDDARNNLEDCSDGWDCLDDTITWLDFGDSDYCTEEETETINNVLSAVDEALQEYPANKVDVYANDYFDVMICSRNDSFPFRANVAKCILGETAMARLTKELDARYVGRCGW